MLLCKVSCRTREWRPEVWWVQHPDSLSVHQAEALLSTRYVYPRLVSYYATSFIWLQFHLLFAFSFRLRECRQGSLRQRHLEDHQVRCRIVGFWLTYKTLQIPHVLSWFLNSDVIRLFRPQQSNSKRPRWKNGLHSEFATPSNSPCRPWSVRGVFYAHTLPAWCAVILTVTLFSLNQKWHLATPYSSTPGTRSVKTNLQPHQEVRARNRVSKREKKKNCALNEQNTSEVGKENDVKNFFFFI